MPRGRNGRGNQGATWSPDSKRGGSVVKRPVAESTESTDQRETVGGESLGGDMARQAKPRRHGMERPSVPHCAGEADPKGRPRSDWQSERRSSSRLTAASYLEGRRVAETAPKARTARPWTTTAKTAASQWMCERNPTQEPGWRSTGRRRRGSGFVEPTNPTPGGERKNRQRGERSPAWRTER